jgi:hypothetical protein
MVINKISTLELSLEQELWTKELTYWRDELKVLEKYLSEINDKNTPHVLWVEVEHFQNQFIRHREVVHELRHELTKHENIVKDLVSGLEDREIQDKKLELHEVIREEVNTGRKIYCELKDEFRNWLAKRME